MGFDFSGLNNAVINAFADDGEIHQMAMFETKTGTHKRECIYSDPFEQSVFGEALIDRPDYTISLHTSDYLAVCAEDGDFVTMREIRYEIVSSEADAAGMTAVQLRKDPA